MDRAKDMEITEEEEEIMGMLCGFLNLKFTENF